MCSSQRPENGADSGWLPPSDYTCDLCFQLSGDIHLERHGGSIAMVCGRCRERAQERYRAMTGDAA